MHSKPIPSRTQHPQPQTSSISINVARPNAPPSLQQQHQLAFLNKLTGFAVPRSPGHQPVGTKSREGLGGQTGPKAMLSAARMRSGDQFVFSPVPTRRYLSSSSESAGAATPPPQNLRLTPERKGEHAQSPGSNAGQNSGFPAFTYNPLVAAIGSLQQLQVGHIPYRHIPAPGAVTYLSESAESTSTAASTQATAAGIP